MHICIFVALKVSATTTLSDPGPLCADETTVLTCNVTGVSIRWIYDGTQFGGLISPSRPPSSDPILVEGGLMFTLSLLENTGSNLVSQLSFTASTDMDGRVVTCINSEGSVDTSILIVQQFCKYVIIGQSHTLYIYIYTMHEIKVILK